MWRTDRNGITIAQINRYELSVSRHIDYPGTLVMRLIDMRSRDALIGLRDLHTTDVAEAQRKAIAQTAAYFEQARDRMSAALEEIAQSPQ
jgi:hypothetical protein